MKANQFDDATLVRVANGYYCGAEEKTEDLDRILQKSELTNPERNQLLFFIEANRHVTPLSIVRMKREIFSLIGFKTSNSYGTVSRAELEAIYNFIMKQRQK